MSKLLSVVVSVYNEEPAVPGGGGAAEKSDWNRRPF